MSPRLPGFATLAAVAILALTTALLSGSVLASRQLLLDQGRAAKTQEAVSAAWANLDRLLSVMYATWNPEVQSIDQWWVGHAPGFPPGCILDSLSARINLNTVTPFLLKDSELNGSLLGRTVEDFVSYRSEKGPFSDPADYKAYFRPEALNELYCAVSFFNVNTADEIMLEKVVGLRTGDEALGSTLRARVRQYRGERKLLSGSDLDSILGAEEDKLGGLLTTEPELDVNTASIAILRSLLEDPDFKLDRPEAKLQLILGGRTSRPWDAESLRAALGVDKGSPLLQYLGVRCRFFGGTIPVGDRNFDFTVLVSYSTDSPPKLGLRVLEAGWSGS